MTAVLDRQNSMLSSLKDLKTLRVKKEQIKESYDNAWQEFLDLNKGIIKRKEDINVQLEAVEESLRVLALDEFKETGSKQLTGGIGIRILKKLEYDYKTAFDWAMLHQISLKLNEKEFEKIMKASSDKPSWLKINDEPQATLPKEIKLEEK